MNSAVDKGSSNARICPEEALIRKRLPRSFPRDHNDVYVTRKTPFKAQLDRCQALLDAGYEAFVHGLGVAVTRAINVALAVKKNNCGSVEVDVRTATVNLVDDIDYADEDRLPGTRTRPNSAVHIRLFRPQIPVLAK